VQETDDLKFIERRRLQSHKLAYVEQLAAKAELLERPFPDKKNNRLLSDIDATNISKLLLKNGPNELPVGTGKYLHIIEITKALKLFKGNNPDDERYDKGVIRVTKLMNKARKGLLKTHRVLIANLPAAGYRIASQEEGVLEIKKSLLRSFGNALAAVIKANFGINPDVLSEEDRETFKGIHAFAERVVIQFSNEIEKQEVASNGYIKTKTRNRYREAKEEVHGMPPT